MTQRAGDGTALRSPADRELAQIGFSRRPVRSRFVTTLIGAADTLAGTANAFVPLLLPSWLDPDTLIKLLGPWALWGVALIVFAECGLFAILPGDSLLFTIGLLVATGVVPHSLVLVCIVLTAAAVLGNVSGYWLGHRIGPPLFKPRPGLVGKIFRPDYVERARHFLDRYGHRALIMARFIPLVRTLVTLVAGVSRMRFRTFITYTAIGGVLWAVGVVLLGYYLGNVGLIRDHVDLMLILIVIVSLIPMAIEFALARRRARRETAETTPRGSTT